jgi:hypothetical protein
MAHTNNNQTQITKTPESTGKNNLEKKFSTGAISSAVWKNEGLNANGEIVEFRSITCQKRYVDKNTKEWKSTECFNIADLPKVIVVLQKAYEYCILRDMTDSIEDD